MSPANGTGVADRLLEVKDLVALWEDRALFYIILIIGRWGWFTGFPVPPLAGIVFRQRAGLWPGVCVVRRKL